MTLAAAGGLSALIHGGHGIAVAQALTVSKGDFAITFAITALTCTTCTEAEFIESFALNLAANQVFKGIFVGLTESERLNQARLYAIAYINSIKQTENYGRVVGKIGEFGNKVSGYWQPFFDKIKSLVQVSGAGNALASFINKKLAQKLDEITRIWNTKYPVQEMLEGRSLFEEIMGHYRYGKGSGWSHTSDISEFFKGVDFYKGTTVGNQIFAETAVSMKTTITTNVDTWLASAPIKKNIDFLEQGLNGVNGLSSNGKFMKITNAEIHIYMPKANITASLKTTWMNKLNTVNPKIKFEIKALEDFIQ